MCGTYFWSVISTSPEVLIFLFFMITDPKTIPEGRAARIAFAVCLGLVCTLLMAPQTTEFGAKVGLSPVSSVITPLRPLDRVFKSERIDSLTKSSTSRPMRLRSGRCGWCPPRLECWP